MAHDPSAEFSWYRDAVVYEAHVRAFQDSNGDGIGDLPGMIERLDYLQDLGVSAVWLLPFCPSPLRDDGYDIADYRGVHPAYGTLRDFRRLLREAHRRRLRVISEVVINHTSDQHAWFQRARLAPAGSPERDYYVWSDTPDRYRGVRIIFAETEASNWTWDPVAGAYYWHRFFSHQPDLNYANPAVPRAIEEVVDFWLDMGVDGVRLDAVPYLWEREGTTCENLPETHAVLKRLRRRLDQRHPDRMLLAEANQWPEDAAAYFGDGDECHMAFHFPLMTRLFIAMRMESRFPIIDILDQTPPIPEGAQWGLFLRNHDELTLEMVTDEERDYMYRHYARDRRARLNLGIRRRLAPLLGNNRREIELVNALLLSLPGTPFLYYGDEIGMGDNIYLGDRNSVRTPMQWSSGRNAGFSDANPQRLYLPVIVDPEYHYQAVNVEAQAANSNSLLWWTRNMLALRRRHPAFGRGSIELLHPDNHRVLAYLRVTPEETVLVVANLSRYAQHVELDLAGFAGIHPLELFGQTEFPPIGASPYSLTVGPHGYLWFSLAAPRPDAAPPGQRERQITLPGSSETAFHDPVRHDLELALARYLPTRPWFGPQGRRLRSVILQDVIPLGRRLPDVYLVLIEADYLHGEPDWFLVPLGIAFGEEAAAVRRQLPELVVSEVSEEDLRGVAFDAAGWPPFAAALLEMLRQRKGAKGEEGTIVFQAAAGMPSPAALADPPVEVSDSLEGHTTIVVGGRYVLKLYRRLAPGTNPDLEVRLFLTERTPLTNLPQVFGWLQYQRSDLEPAVLAILQEYVPNRGTVRQELSRSLGRFFAAVPSWATGAVELPAGGPLSLIGRPPPVSLAELAGEDLATLTLLGRRVAQLHRGLACDDRDPEFRPERFTGFDQRALYQALRSSLRQSLRQLRAELPRLPEEARPAIEAVLAIEKNLLKYVQRIASEHIDAARIRIHGDLGLEAVLIGEGGFVFYEFAGDTTSPIGDRRLRRSPLWDIADALRSLHELALSSAGERAGLPGGASLSTLEPWAQAWYAWAAAALLEGYLGEMEGTGLLPTDPEHLRLMLTGFLLERTARQLARDAGGHRHQVWISAGGLLDTVRWSAPPG